MRIRNPSKDPRDPLFFLCAVYGLFIDSTLGKKVLYKTMSIYKLFIHAGTPLGIEALLRQPQALTIDHYALFCYCFRRPLGCCLRSPN